MKNTKMNEPTKISIPIKNEQTSNSLNNSTKNTKLKNGSNEVNKSSGGLASFVNGIWHAKKFIIEIVT